MDTEVRCPNCGTTKYANVNLRMMVNICGHSLCENCVENLFMKGAGKCPTCGALLKRTQFRIQLYDDETVEREIEVRKRLHKELFLNEQDFATLDEYNDYLELFETFVDNLANNIDVMETNRRIDEFRTEHAGRLAKGRGKISLDLLLIEEELEKERALESSRDLLLAEDECSRAARKVATARENLVDELLQSDGPAEVILRNHKHQAQIELAALDEMEQKRLAQRAEMVRRRQQNLTTTTGLRINEKMRSFEEQPPTGEPYVYRPLVLVNHGPACPTPRTIVRQRFMDHVRTPSAGDLAGGFSALYPCQRALQEAIIDLTFIPVSG